VEQASDGIALVDASSQRLLEANEALSTLLECAPEALADLTLRDVLDLERRELERGLLEARRGSWRFGEQRLRRQGGTLVDVELSVNLVSYGGRAVLCAVVRDISERKRAEEEVRRAREDLERRVEERTQELAEAYASLQTEVAQREQMQADLEHRDEQLRQAQKMEAIGRLAGGVAHDFNNLLTAINSYAELLVRHLAGQERLQRYARGIEATAERAAGLTRQLLTFSRKQVLEPHSLDLNRLVADLDRMLRRVIGEDVELSTVLQPELWAVHADQSQLEQVLMNLVVNARDALPRGGCVVIETANVALDEGAAFRCGDLAPGEYVTLAVADDGTGMDAETLARAFDPFFTTKPPGQGTGLGLATVYGIVNQSGGHVWAHSEPGRGTTFRIYLPRDAGSGSAAGLRPSSPVPASRARPEGETLLLVEDDDGVRFPLREGLQSKGYTVLEAADGEEALTVAARHPGRLDLLITDVVMPRRNGRELAERLLAERPELRVLYMSGYTDDAVVRTGILTSSVAFLQKPFSVEALARRVRRVLDEPAAA
jgi:PAS domain S-box-containing protein